MQRSRQIVRCLHEGCCYVAQRRFLKRHVEKQHNTVFSEADCEAVNSEEVTTPARIHCDVENGDVEETPHEASPAPLPVNSSRESLRRLLGDIRGQLRSVEATLSCSHSAESSARATCLRCRHAPEDAVPPAITVPTAPSASVNRCRRLDMCRSLSELLKMCDGQLILLRQKRLVYCRVCQPSLTLLHERTKRYALLRLHGVFAYDGSDALTPAAVSGGALTEHQQQELSALAAWVAQHFSQRRHRSVLMFWSTVLRTEYVFRATPTSGALVSTAVKPALKCVVKPPHHVAKAAQQMAPSSVLDSEDAHLPVEEARDDLAGESVAHDEDGSARENDGSGSEDDMVEVDSRLWPFVNCTLAESPTRNDCTPLDALDTSASTPASRGLTKIVIKQRSRPDETAASSTEDGVAMDRPPPPPLFSTSGTVVHSACRQTDETEVAESCSTVRQVRRSWQSGVVVKSLPPDNLTTSRDKVHYVIKVSDDPSAARGTVASTPSSIPTSSSSSVVSNASGRPRTVAIFREHAPPVVLRRNSVSGEDSSRQNSWSSRRVTPCKVVRSVPADEPHLTRPSHVAQQQWRRRAGTSSRARVAVKAGQNKTRHQLNGSTDKTRFLVLDSPAANEEVSVSSKRSTPVRVSTPLSPAAAAESAQFDLTRVKQEPRSADEGGDEVEARSPAKRRRTMT